MKILIVDDDVIRTASLVNYLISENVIPSGDVYTSTDFDDAVLKVSSFHFDVLILDVVIPKRADEQADSKWAFALLQKIGRSKSVKKPGKIIGITGYLEDLGKFKTKFEEYCLIVIEANRTTVGWKRRIADYIGYDYLAQAHRVLDGDQLNVVTIHGIRTFGHWQNRLRELTHENLSSLPFHSYRYGYTSFFALFSKSAHRRHVDLLRKRLLGISITKDGRFIFFSHSFGTFLLIETLREMALNDELVPIKVIVLSGSVLKSDFDLSFLLDRGIQVVNDCAQSDYVLWLSEAAVPGLGMAGKLGFYGFENSLLTNRYFVGGHSSYFAHDDFMIKYWLPVIGGVGEVKSVDNRTSSPLENDFVEEIVMAMGRGKDGLVRLFRRASKFFV